MVYFARYDSKAIKVNRKRKRAIAKQAAKNRPKVIEVGDTVEVIGSFYSAGFDNGTIAIVEELRYGVLNSVRVKAYLSHIDYWSTRIHAIGDLKLIEKGSKQHG